MEKNGITSLLDSALVRKYFAPECVCITTSNKNEDCMGRFASSVLDAMQQPIRKGELYLYWDEEPQTCGWMEGVNECDSDARPFHPKELRLPDAFQKRECDHRPGCLRCAPCKPKDAVEEKIKEIENGYIGQEFPNVGMALRDLVRLARETL